MVTFLFGSALGLAILAVGLLLHFLPAFIAFRNDHPSKFPVLLVNLFLGWTLIGWIIALIWALSPPRPAAPRAW